MKTKDAFIVGVRVVGLFTLAKALDYLIAGFDISVGIYKPSPAESMGRIYSHILVYLAVGIYLLSGAPHLVRLVYERTANKRTDQATIGE
jgi:hypothetical protein